MITIPYADRVLRRTTVHSFTVETVWHGTNFPQLHQYPFGTAVKCEHGVIVEEVAQYDTTEEAVAGHVEALAYVEVEYEHGCGGHETGPEDETP